MLDVRRLRLLRELHARGTIAAVADALQYTPSAVSQQLAVLEREAGVALIERIGRGVRLTDAGRRLVEHAEAVIARLEAAEADLATGGELRGRVRVAAFQTAARALVAPAFIALARRAPELRCELVEMDAEESLPLLRVGEVDIVVAEEYEHAPRPHDRAFERHPLGLDRLVLVLAEDHPAARAGGPVALKALADEAWAAPRPGTAFNDMVVRACRSLGGFEPDVRHQANDLRLLLHLARSGLAVALVPSLGHEREPGVAVRELKGRGLGREIFAATRRGSDGRPAVAATLAALAEQAGANGLITD